MNTFGFTIRFLTPAGRNIDISEAESTFSISGMTGSYELKHLPPKANHVNGSPEVYTLTGSGFGSHSEAETVGHELMAALSQYGAKHGIGLDVGKNTTKSAFAKNVKEEILKNHSIQLRNVIHGLDVFEESYPVTYMEISATGSVSRVTKGFSKEIESFITVHSKIQDKEKLALEIYNASFFETSVNTRFLQLVTVIEILSEQRSRSSGELKLIDRFKAEVNESDLTEKDRDTLINAIGNLKRESISTACRNLVLNASGEEDEKIFRECYMARSQLVHNGQTKKNVHELIGPLEHLVNKVIMSIG